MINIILTGEKRIGKSTIIRKIADRLPFAPGGFYTQFDGARGRDKEYLLLGDGTSWQKAVHFRHHAPVEVYLDAFDCWGVELLNRGGRLIVMDELGRLERDALVFQQAIRDVFDSEMPALAVVQRAASLWLDELKSHPQSRIFEVTEENRDALPDEIWGLMHEQAIV